MMHLTGPGPAPRRNARRAWIPLALLAGTGAYLSWPSAEQGGELVEAAKPDRAGTPGARLSTPQAGYATRPSARVTATNLFESHSWFVAPPPPPPQKLGPAVPVAPPLPFTLLGTYARAGEPAVYFLVKDDRIFDAHVGDVLDKDYSVDAAENGQLRLTYLPLGIKQSLAVGGAP